MKYWFIIFLPFIAAKISAQGNLVPNPGFEYHTNCPSGGAQVLYLPPWAEYNSADYYDTCSTNSNYDIPDNFEGYQYPRTGQAYCGLITFLGSPTLHNNYREFIQTVLTDPLKPGKEYCIQFYVNVADTSHYFCSSIGVHFASTAIYPLSWAGSYYVINYSAQAENPITNPITDSIGWTAVSLHYTAQGGESYLTIGNFSTDSNSVWQYIPNGSGTAQTYLFIDDVSVYEEKSAIAGINSTLCVTDSLQIGSLVADSGVVYSWSPQAGLSDPSSSRPWASPDSTTTYMLTISDPDGLYCLANTTDSITITINDCPIPPEYFVSTILKKSESFIISALPENTGLEIFDTRGRLIYRNENYQNDFRASNLAVGVYAYRLNFADGSSQKGKVCVVE
jgi:hypothetical protein